MILSTRDDCLGLGAGDLLDLRAPRLPTRGLGSRAASASFLAKLTDHDRANRDLLRCRVWDIYSWRPTHAPEPVRPSGYDDLVWAPFEPAVANAKAVFGARVARCGGSRTAKFITALGAFAAAVLVAAPAAEARDDRRPETCKSYERFTGTVVADCRAPGEKPRHCESTNITGTTKTECR